MFNPAILLSSFLLCLIGFTSGQLTFRTEPNLNTFTIQQPSWQQTFTRHFNGQPGTLFQAAQPQQQQPQYTQAAQPAQQYEQPQYQGFSGLRANFPQVQPTYQPQPAYTQQQYQPQYQTQYQPQYQQQYQPQQPNPYYQPQAQQSNDLATYYRNQQAQQQNPLNVHGLAQLKQAPEQQELQSESHAQPQQLQATSAPNPVRINFSPANEVSQVKYSSNGLNYNF